MTFGSAGLKLIRRNQNSVCKLSVSDRDPEQVLALLEKVRKVNNVES